MATGNLFEQPTIVRLQVLIENVRSGKLLLPEFQRPFVWEDKQRLLLFDSIVTGLPIGSLLLWRTSLNIGTKDELEGFPLPPAAEGTLKTYVLDGQQRVFTLYASLAAEQHSVMHDGEKRRWPIFLDLEIDLDSGSVGGESRFKLARRDRPTPSTWLPLSAVFNPKGLLAYQAGMYKEGKDKLAERAEEVVNIFKDYPVALVPIVTDNLRLATLSFQRVNSQGSPMSEAHMWRALTYEKNFDLTQRFEQFASSLPWGSVDHQVLVNTLKALLGVNIYGADVSMVIPKLKEHQTPTSVLTRMEKGITAAVKFLTTVVSIWSEEALPYSYQLVALAYAAAKGGDLARNKEPLARWFWATTYTEYFTGMTANQLRRSFEHVWEICEGADPIPVDMDKRCSPLTRYRWPSVRALAFMHLLARHLEANKKTATADNYRILARGGSSSSLLYIKRPAGLPENRILVAPENAAATRLALTNSLSLFSTESELLREAHILPPSSSPASDSVETTLEWRKARLKEIESDFISSLGLEVTEPAETNAIGYNLS